MQLFSAAQLVNTELMIPIRTCIGAFWKFLDCAKECVVYLYTHEDRMPVVVKE